MGVGVGVALSDYGGSSVSAGIAEISVDQTTGAIRVHRFWMAIDAGFILSPRNTEAQMEGTIIYGLSNALKERITVNGGVVEQSNFYDYQVMRINEVPDVEVRALTNTRPAERHRRARSCDDRCCGCQRAVCCDRRQNAGSCR